MLKTVGVLGGMGPLATVDFMNKVIVAATRLLGAVDDADHIPLVVQSIPQIPSRSAALRTDRPGRSPLPELQLGIRRLTDAGAALIVIPCNTAHAWFDALQAVCAVPIVHIADTAVDALRRRSPVPRRIALFATAATRSLGFYQERLAAAGIEVVLPAEAVQAELGQAIAAVKAGDIAAARARVEPAVRTIVAAGAEAVLLGCTELPLAAADIGEDVLIDATYALAEAAVRASAGLAL